MDKRLWKNPLHTEDYFFISQTIDTSNSSQNFEHIKCRQDLSNNLKEMREDCSFSQQQIAEKLGIDRSTYSYYETGKTTPDILALIKIAEIFGISVFYLLVKNGRDLYRRELK